MPNRSAGHACTHIWLHLVFCPEITRLNAYMPRYAASAGTAESAADQASALRSYDENRYETQRFALPPGFTNVLEAAAGQDDEDNAAEDGKLMKRLAAGAAGPAAKKQKMKAGTAAREIDGKNARVVQGAGRTVCLGDAGLPDSKGRGCIALHCPWCRHLHDASLDV